MLFLVEFEIEREGHNYFLAGIVAVELFYDFIKLLSVRDYLAKFCLNLQKLELVLLCDFILSLDFAKRKIKLSLHLPAFFFNLIHNLFQTLQIISLLLDCLIDFKGIFFELLIFKRLNWFLAPIIC